MTYAIMTDIRKIIVFSLYLSIRISKINTYEKETPVQDNLHI